MEGICRTDVKLLPARLYAADAVTAPSDVDSVQSNAAATSDSSQEPAAAAGGGRQSRSLSMLARALGKGLDSRRPSTVAAVFNATARRASPRRGPGDPRRVSPPRHDDEDGAVPRTRRLTGSSVTWQDSADRRRSDDDTASDTRLLSVEQTRGKRLDPHTTVFPVLFCKRIFSGTVIRWQSM